MTNLPPAVMLDLIKKEKERRAADRSLLEFTRQSFYIIEPGQEFRFNWHINVICEHLEAISRGDIQNLIINVPPGCMKSILVCVAWPSWEWAHDPKLRHMSASYGSDLSIRDAAKTKDIVTSDWYQERWPDVKIKPGADQKIKYELTGGGWRMATSVGGRATGEHPDRKIVDDPHNAKQAESEAERETALTWYDRTLSTRGKSRGARTVVVMQRLHERDLTGHILEDLTGYDHLRIPMEYDMKRRVTTLGSYDPRKQKNELLWPEMFDKQDVEELKQVLGSYGASGQLQQDPVPADGGILKRDHFRIWPAGQRRPPLLYVVQSYDSAFSENTQNDPTACTVWGVFKNKDVNNVILLDAWDEHLSYPELRKKVLEDYVAEYGADVTRKAGMPVAGRKPDRVLVEAKASGQSLIQDLRLAHVPVIPYNPGHADKIARAHQAAPTLELGFIWVPESTQSPGKPVSWAEPFLKQIAKFPVAAHDDYVDTFTQLVIYLKNTGWLDLPKAKIEIERAPDKPVINPYGV